MISAINFLSLHQNMRLFFKNIVFRCMIMLLVVQTLNLSINSLDFYTPLKGTNSLEDQDYIDSMVEFLVENVMGFSKDTFHDKANPDSASKLQHFATHIDFKWVPNTVIKYDLVATQNQVVYNIPEDEKINILFIKEVRPNPPQFPAV